MKTHAAVVLTLVLASPGAATAADGARIFADTCQACHQANLTGGYVGPPLDGVGERLFSGYIYSYLKNPQKIKPAVPEPNRNLSDTDARALTAYLVSLPVPKERR